MTAEASVDQAIPAKTTLFIQSVIRSLIVALVARYFPDLSTNPSLATVIDFAVALLVASGMAWVSATSTRRHALNAVVSILNNPPPPESPK